MTSLSGLTSLEAGARPLATRRPRPRPARPGPLPARAWGLLWALAVGLALWSFLAGRDQLLNPAGLPLLAEFWAGALHPDLSPDYLAATAGAAATTVAFATLGTVLSVLLGAALALPMSQRWWAASTTGRAARLRGATGLLLTRAAVGLPRGVHEAVWALLLISVLGRDPLVGVLAIALPFGAITAKVYAEILDEAGSGPYDALRAAGAGRLAAVAYALLPATWASLTSYAFYRFECSLRSAVVLGLVGVGGLGFSLSTSFAGLRYDQLWTCLYALVLLSALADRWGAALRGGAGRRRWAASAVGGAALVIGSVWYLGPEVARWFSARTAGLLLGLAEDLTPLRLPRDGWSGLLAGAVETVQMSVLAATLATLLAVAVAFVAARGSGSAARSFAAWLARGVLLVTRAVPPPVWALLVLFVVLPGPLPGALALGIYTFGVLGRLFAEVVENLDPRPRDVLTGAGAPPVAAFAYATVPAAAGHFAAYGLYRWEVAARETVVVGVVGAGGLGRLLEQQRVAFDYPAMATTILALVVVSLLVDAVGMAVRRSLR